MATAAPWASSSAASALPAPASGGPYLPEVMRWTTRTNLELCMLSIEAGRPAVGTG